MNRPHAAARILRFIRGHPLVTFYVLLIGISWGGGLIVLGLDVFVGLKPMARTQMPLALLFAWLGTTGAALACTALVSGRAGLRELRARWTTWRIGWIWYAVALLTAPALTVLILSILAVISGSDAFLPGLVTAPDKLAVVAIALGVGLVNGFFEEMGWVGFAIPRFLRRYGIATTGLIVGLMWGAWHYPFFAGDAFAGGASIAPALYLAILLFGWLTPYRILMVWAYNRTQSAVIVWLMHVAIDFNVLAIDPPAASKDVTLGFTLPYAAALWLIALAVTAAPRIGAARRVTSTPVAAH